MKVLPNSTISGLAVAVGLWFAGIVAFGVGIVLVPLSSVAASCAALASFSVLTFLVGRTWGNRTATHDRLAWGVAVVSWLAPWALVLGQVQGLSLDLGSVYGACGAVVMILMVIPALLLWLGLRRSWKKRGV